jgi:ankyrin repeat protein
VRLDMNRAMIQRRFQNISDLRRMHGSGHQGTERKVEEYLAESVQHCDEALSASDAYNMLTYTQEHLDAGQQEVKGWTLLMIAACDGVPEAIRHLLAEAGPNATELLHAQEPHGMTALMLAAMKGVPSGVLCLLQCGANPNQCDRDGHSALMHAALGDGIGGNTCKVIEILLSYRADINAECNDGSSALMLACLYGHRDEECFLLIRSGADLEMKNHAGDTAFHIACGEGKTSAAAAIMAACDANPYAFNNGGESPLFLANTPYGHGNDALDILESLLTFTDDLNLSFPDKNGNTLLHHLSSGPLLNGTGDEEGIEQVLWLLQNGAQINARNHAGNTPLQCRIIAENETDEDFECMYILLTNGASLKTRNNAEKTPMQLAMHLNKGDVVLAINAEILRRCQNHLMNV